MNTRNKKPTAAAAAKSKSAKKAEQTSESRTSPANPTAPAPGLVRVHELTGLAVLHLPQALREILGEECWRNCLEDTQEIELSLNVRQLRDVVYLRLPVLVHEMTPASHVQMLVDVIRLAERKATSPASGKKRRRT